jgi:hypothetical protein
LTVDEWIGIAHQRDPRPFRHFRDEEGNLWLTDGEYRLALPIPWPRLEMPSAMVAMACQYFALEGYWLDFALDPSDF